MDTNKLQKNKIFLPNGCNLLSRQKKSMDSLITSGILGIKMTNVLIFISDQIPQKKIDLNPLTLYSNIPLFQCSMAFYFAKAFDFQYGRGTSVQCLKYGFLNLVRHRVSD